jgi:RES domain-containing protein
VRFQGIAYRAHNPRWAWSPVSGEGARLNGGRFNPKGMPALYLSLQTHTAIREASQGFAYRFPPLTLVTYDIDCSDVVDLTKSAAQRWHQVSRTELGCAWLGLALSGEAVPTWQLAKRLTGEGCAGIIVSSFAPGARKSDTNLVLWKWSDTLPHRVQVFDPDSRLARGK